MNKSYIKINKDKTGIEIRRGIKYRCLVLPLIFNICNDQLMNETFSGVQGIVVCEYIVKNWNIYS